MVALAVALAVALVAIAITVATAVAHMIVTDVGETVIVTLAAAATPMIHTAPTAPTAPMTPLNPRDPLGPIARVHIDLLASIHNLQIAN